MRKLLTEVMSLHSYGVSHLSINMISNNRTHRTKINEYFSDRSRIEKGTSHGSVLGPLPFHTDSIDLFYECEERNIASFADDTTLYTNSDF